VVATVILVLSAASGVVAGSQNEDTSSTSPTTTSTVPQQSVPTTTIAIETTTTTIAPSDYTQSVIDTSSKEVVLAAWNSIRARPSNKMKWSGSIARCDAGTTSDAFKEDVLHRVQWFRAMAGVDPRISLNKKFSALAQEAALVMHANNDLSHYPSSSWECFSDDAYTGASNSNLFLGVFGEKSIIGYIEDSGDDNMPVGHRRWILGPHLEQIGTGDTPNSNALYVADKRNPTNSIIREPDGFVLWPPRGYVPRSVIFPRWSVSHLSADFSSATVRISHNGKTRFFADPFTDNERYGNLNSITFEWKTPERGAGNVQVAVSNVSIGGVYTTLKYEVIPID